ncbi:GNAT family N-acetyltransferase [Halorubrum sp. FL23]|uniref:GNAT family N-acetyltransferase n=1 Tax=Halorubrum sp. FL23 TaxID=3458704 RepID=UPI004033ED17
MTVCNDCELPIERVKKDNTEDSVVCNPCRHLRNEDLDISIRPLSWKDLELVLAWRSNPEIYQHFRLQEGPLNWSEHVKWYESRDSDRHDFIIRYLNRRVGGVSIDSTDEIGIYLGDFSAHGHGVATTALKWACARFSDRTPLLAEIHEKNEASQRLFERCGFKKTSENDSWLKYSYDS